MAGPPSSGGDSTRGHFSPLSYGNSGFVLKMMQLFRLALAVLGVPYTARPFLR